MIFRKKNLCECCEARERTRILLMDKEDDGERIEICDECRNFIDGFLDFTSSKWVEVVDREIVVKKRG